MAQLQAIVQEIIGTAIRIRVKALCTAFLCGGLFGVSMFIAGWVAHG